MPALPASPVPARAIRALTAHAQGLSAPPEQPANAQAIQDMVAALGCLQIDTLQMVARSHLLALWSRLGCYEPAQLDALLFHPGQRRLFEYWKKAASIIPLEQYRFSMARMRARRENPGRQWQRWLKKPESPGMLDMVRGRIRNEGGLRAADFRHEGPRRGQWWDWKPAKLALEYLFGIGELMVSERRNFQRVYDLGERVLPAGIDTREATLAEADRHDIAEAVRALGLCESRHAGNYAYMSLTRARAALVALREDGTLLELEGETVAGETRRLWLHRARIGELQQALDGALEPRHTTFLNPLDNLLWARGHDQAYWDFGHRIEMYLPAPKRVYGYYSMPILQRGRLIGRIDPRLERSSGTLELRALHLEPGVAADERLIADVAQALRDFMAWHGAKELRWGRRGSVEFRRKLRAAL